MRRFSKTLIAGAVLGSALMAGSVLNTTAREIAFFPPMTGG